MAYETTTVSVEKSQGAIRSLLVAHGAREFQFGESSGADGVRLAAVGFVANGHAVRMRVPHKPINQRDLARRLTRARTKDRATIASEMEEQEAKRIWRVLHWNLKARMEAVQEGVETFEEAFLAHLLDERTGETIYETLARSGSIDLGMPLLQLEAGSEA